MNIRYIKGFIISFLLGRSYLGYGLHFDDNHFNSLIYLDSLFNIPDNPGPLSISTFNIQLLGHFKKKDNEALADLLKDINIVQFGN